MRWIILLFLTMSLAACAVKVTPADSGARAQHGEHHHGGEGHHERD